MAEALSVAASGIAVAQVSAQVGKSIIKLKQLWDEIQDAPSTIRDLLDQIECLDPALWEAENTFGQTSLPPMFWDDSLASRSTAYCRKVLSSLTELVDELTLQINRPGKLRSKLACAKVVLKKEQLKSLERRLQNAVRMLALAQQSYLVALTRIQPHIIIQRFTEITTPLVARTIHPASQLERLGSTNAHRRQLQLPSRATKPADDEDSENHVLTLRRRPERQDFRNSFRFRLPFWLSRTTWELQSSRSYGNWKLNLRCYSVVPVVSEVLEIAQYGTPRELEMLCARGLASPYDRDDDGWTLLHWAMWGLNQPMVRYLLDIGLSPSELNNDGDTPIEAVKTPFSYESNALFLTNWSLNELEILLDPLDTSVDPEGKVCTCSISLMSKDVKKMYQGFECPSHETTTLESRLSQLFDDVDVVEDPMVIPDLLQPYWSQDLRALCATSIRTCVLLHAIALGFGQANGGFIDGWAFLADMVICNTPNIHQITGLGDTSWLVALEANAQTLVSSRLRLWLSKIRSNGYDLEEYGRRENELLADKDLIPRTDLLIYRRVPGTCKRYDIAQLRGYEYGPEPEDWKILLSFPEKSYAADFWSLVEDGPRVVPGAWVEDSDDEEGYT
ncbi:hypothetical protein GGR58DRAFT_27062 [Xylaria digitata]|nr:hypothetical protein GGR58DRAFT_27062 [Xylaria digitata]